jgi:hypothetical protein
MGRAGVRYSVAPGEESFLSDERLEQLYDGAGPRGQELKFLIEMHGKDLARAEELKRALQTPRWTNRWPLWEQHQRQVQKEMAALAEVREEAERRGLPPPPAGGDDLFEDPDFIAELDAMDNA